MRVPGKGEPVLYPSRRIGARDAFSVEVSNEIAAPTIAPRALPYIRNRAASKQLEHGGSADSKELCRLSDCKKLVVGAPRMVFARCVSHCERTPTSKVPRKAISALRSIRMRRVSLTFSIRMNRSAGGFGYPPSGSPPAGFTLRLSRHPHRTTTPCRVTVPIPSTRRACQYTSGCTWTCRELAESNG